MQNTNISVNRKLHQQSENTQAAGPRNAVSLRHEEDNKSSSSVSLDATFLRLCSSGDRTLDVLSAISSYAPPLVATPFGRYLAT
ncbi:hypothetical protein RIR_jg24828.t1 [Rhizophagus irregularis DAOM 181602=DAOM 197198]|nr:hypothetical protein RIR_jg24828.t1 [Rhizophagus irregularis DAOM 181602=DAOM 197198]